MVIGGSVPGVVVVEGYTVVVVVESRGMNCVFVNVKKANTDTPRPRMVPRMRRIERSLGSMVFEFAFATCPALTSFAGWRNRTTLASFPFISDTEPKKVLHLQLVRVCV